MTCPVIPKSKSRSLRDDVSQILGRVVWAAHTD